LAGQNAKAVKSRPKEKISSRRLLILAGTLLHDIVNRANHPNVRALQRSDERFIVGLRSRRASVANAPAIDTHILGWFAEASWSFL
jgi:hypothetical protein